MIIYQKRVDQIMRIKLTERGPPSERLRLPRGRDSWAARVDASAAWRGAETAGSLQRMHGLKAEVRTQCGSLAWFCRGPCTTTMEEINSETSCELLWGPTRWWTEKIKQAVDLNWTSRCETLNPNDFWSSEFSSGANMRLMNVILTSHNNRQMNNMRHSYKLIVRLIVSDTSFFRHVSSFAELTTLPSAPVVHWWLLIS